MKITDIRPNPGNPRLIKDDKFQKLCSSIQEFPKMMELRPIVYNSEGIILGGNMRYKALKHLGYKEIPDNWTRQADQLTPEEERRFIVEDNASMGEWDWVELQKQYLDSELEAWGLDLPDLEIQDEKKIEEDEYTMPDEIKTDIKPGDLFEIGKHRILCGDSTSAKDVEQLMAGKKAGLVFTDPPYGVSYQGTDNGDGSKWTMIKNDDLRGDGLVRVLLLAFENCLNHTKKDVALYCWYASKTHIQFETALLAAGWEVKQQLIWNKGMTLGHADYHWAHEPLLYCKKKDQTTEWYGDRTAKTILRQKRTELTNLKKEELVQIIKNLLDNSSTWEIDREKVVNYQHPTQKPVTLAGRAILNSSKEGDIVLDLFGGSGSTMVAGEQADRKVYMMELDPKYVQVIVDRMRKFNEGIQIKRNGKPYAKAE